jgi:hypothetical protein
MEEDDVGLIMEVTRNTWDNRDQVMGEPHHLHAQQKQGHKRWSSRRRRGA